MWLKKRNMDAEDLTFNTHDRVLLLGATGFVGSRLTSELAVIKIKLRLFVRNLQKAAPLIPEGSDSELVQGDLFVPESLTKALKGIHTTYYLVHSMGGKSIFSNTERTCKNK